MLLPWETDQPSASELPLFWTSFLHFSISTKQRSLLSQYSTFRIDTILPSTYLQSINCGACLQSHQFPQWRSREEIALQVRAWMSTTVAVSPSTFPAKKQYTRIAICHSSSPVSVMADMKVGQQASLLSTLNLTLVTAGGILAVLGYCFTTVP